MRDKKGYIKFWHKTSPFPKKWSNAPPKQFFAVSLENTGVGKSRATNWFTVYFTCACSLSASMVTCYSSYFITIYSTTVRLRNILQPMKFGTKKNEENSHMRILGQHCVTFAPVLLFMKKMVSHDIIQHVIVTRSRKRDHFAYDLEIELTIWEKLDKICYKMIP